MSSPISTFTGGTDTLLSGTKINVSGSGTYNTQSINATDSYIIFTAGTSTLQIKDDIMVNLLMVGGGGGSGPSMNNQGGGSGGIGGSGGSGHVYEINNFILPKGTYNLTIGIGGSTYTNSTGDGGAGNGGTTQIVNTSGVTLLAIAGGGGGVGSQNGNPGNSNKINNYSAGGGGGSGWLGNASGFGISGNANGLQGGGAIPGSTSNAGKSSSITGTSVVYGGGGILGNNTLLTAYGAGANSPTNGNSTGFTGNSGVVIIRYKVADNNTITNSTNFLISGNGTTSIMPLNDIDSYISFTSGISTLNVTQDTIVDILLVGGGGGGGRFGAGGGAGAVLYTTNFTIPVGTHIITVGSGGSGAVDQNKNGTNGIDTTISINGYIYNAIGGGGGGSRNDPGGYSGRGGNNGGSGGGGSHSDSSTTVNIGGLSFKNTYTNWTSLGNSGGEGKDGTSGGYGSGGGGGAGSIGANGSTNSGGNGGSGINLSSIFGSNVGDSGWFAGGGGGGSYTGTSGTAGFANGGSGLLGGGGNAIINGSGISGIANTGGGGGGSDINSGQVGGTGGSGVVIIKFKTQSFFNPLNLITSGNGISTYQQINSTDSYISFTSGTSRLIITKNITVDLLLVGGGGGGGGSERGGGGGGAGALIYQTNTVLSAGTYDITVGAGGAKGGFIASNGNDTIINSLNSGYIYLAKGGGGGAGDGNSMISGGSSGGVLNNLLSSFPTIPPTTSNIPIGTYGYTGGSSINATGGEAGFAASGGGGAGGAGGNATGSASTATAGNGGIGLQIAITGVNTYYGGGGGGGCASTSVSAGTGGLGGGGNGSKGVAVAGDGQANTGGGGGGSGFAGASNGTPGNGGSGIVIIRFKNSDNIIDNIKYLIYNNSGTVIFNTPTICDVLIVGGGGGGGVNGGTEGGGGGGGGGVGVGKITFKPNITYTITIGAGGTSTNAGGNSSIVGDVINEIAYGGGGGGFQTGGNGGSGGGASGNNGNFSGGIPTFGISSSTDFASINYFGNNGGNAIAGQGGAGGGGAGSIGNSSPGNNNGANGGNGYIWIFNNNYYGGGGGGSSGNSSASFGIGGLGGGGNGGQGNSSGIGANGIANTGGGGGGSRSTGGTGGSGIIIIRYSLIPEYGKKNNTVSLSILKSTLNITKDSSFTILKDVSNNVINPIAWYKFDNSSAFGTDSMGNFNLTSSGSSIAYNNSNIIKGTGSLYLTGGWITGTGANLNSKNFSISVWIYRVSAVDCNIYGSDGGFAAYSTFIFGWYSNNWIYINFYGPEVNYNDTTLNEWVHYTFTYNITGYVMKLYRNGVLVSTNTSGNQVYNTGNATSSYSIGRRYGGAGAQQSGNNTYLSDFRIYTNLELTQTQVNELYRGNLTGEYRLSTLRNRFPNIASTETNLSIYMTSKKFMGLTPLNPGKNALSIKNNSSTSIDGNYYILCNNIPTETYCLMDNKYNGGGWMMIMKATRSDTFNYEANYWTTANTLNSSDLTINDSDAKYNVFNYIPIKDVMAIWPDIANDFGNSTGGSLTISDGWVWLVNDWYNTGRYIEPLAGFQIARNANPSNVYSFAGFRSGTFSTQAIENRHVFGGHSHIGNNNWGTVRWGFVWNENGAGDFNSCDAWSGIGVSRAFGAFGNSGKSAGDNYGCCGTAGLNRQMKMRLYGR